MSSYLDLLPPDATGLRLYRYSGDELISCEPVIFRDGRLAVDTVLRRAAISGRVEINGRVRDYFADILTGAHSWSETVALDKGSYRALKNRWMRCRETRR